MDATDQQQARSVLVHVAHLSLWVLTSMASPSAAADGKSICFEWEGTEPGGFSQRDLGRDAWPEKKGF